MLKGRERTDLAEVSLVSISQALLHLIHLVLEVLLTLLHAPCKLRLQPCNHFKTEIPLSSKLEGKNWSIAGLFVCCVGVIRLTDMQTGSRKESQQYDRPSDMQMD